MEIRNNNQIFGAKLGCGAKYHLKNTPEKLEQISNRIANFGESTTVIDIMHSETKKGKNFSLRMYNEVFGTKHSISMLKDNQNKEVVSFNAKDFLNALESITEDNILFREYNLFSKIKKDFLALPMGIKHLSEKLKLAKSEGKTINFNKF